MFNFSRFVAPLFGADKNAQPVAFMKAFRMATQPIVNGEGRRLWVTPEGGTVRIKLSQDISPLPSKGDRFLIEKIVAETPGKGHGSAAMGMLSQLADEHFMHLAMYVNPIEHKAKDEEALRRWAAQHSFEEYGWPSNLFWRDPNPAPKELKPA